MSQPPGDPVAPDPLWLTDAIVKPVGDEAWVTAHETMMMACFMVERVYEPVKESV